MKKYELTEEHRAQLKPHADWWIKNALSTKAMDDHDRSEMRKAIKGLYESANLVPPPDERIVFVSSPFVARFAGGFAAAIWWLRNNKKENVMDATRAATQAATRDATEAATGDATWAATEAATRAATWDATRAATDDATRYATWAATEAATWYATRDATEDATRDATRDATKAATEDATGSATWAATEAATWYATRDVTEAATWDATRDATEAATEDATRAATEDATWYATRDATEAATEDATWDATVDATRAATGAATEDATEAAIWAATEDATRAATSITKNKWFNFSIKSMINLSINLKIGKFGLDCAYESSKMWNGGNQWSAYPSFLSFFRYVAKLNIDYTKWDYYEKAAIHAGHRIMHEKFCIISDRPEILKIDEQNRPHSFDGPFCRWRDGSALYSIHGIRVPMWICETKKEDFTKEMIVNETNADNRRCIIQKIGIEKAIELLGADVIDSYESPIGGKYELLQIDYDGRGKRCYLKMKSKSIDAYHIEGIKPGITTVKEAIAYRNGLDKFEEPEILT